MKKLKQRDELTHLRLQSKVTFTSKISKQIPSFLILC